MTKLTAGEAIIKIMKAEGVRHVFGLPGGHILPLYDGIYKTEGIEHVLVRHEQSAANMAAAYAQLTGGPGVCIVTAGPGATNLVTGIAEAFVGSLPVVVFAARGASKNLPEGGQSGSLNREDFRPHHQVVGSRRPHGYDSRDRAPRIHDRAWRQARPRLR